MSLFSSNRASLLSFWQRGFHQAEDESAVVSARVEFALSNLQGRGTLADLPARNEHVEPKHTQPTRSWTSRHFLEHRLGDSSCQSATCTVWSMSLLGWQIH